MELKWELREQYRTAPSQVFDLLDETVVKVSQQARCETEVYLGTMKRASKRRKRGWQT